MNSSFFIARKIIESGRSSNKNSQTIIKFAVIGTILSTTIMILTIFISYGFKSNILDKVRHFDSDIHIINYDANQSYDLSPIKLKPSQTEQILKLKSVSSLSGFITKPSILKFNSNIEGIVLKSYQKEENYSYIKSNIVKGKFPNFDRREILISEDLSKQLQLDTGQSVILYFIQEPIRYRKLKVSGIYKTAIYEFDHIFAFVDFKLLQKINAWDSSQVSGFEIKLIDNCISNEQSQKKIETIIRPNYFETNRNTSAPLLKTLGIKQRFEQFYFWFDLFDTNVLVIISLMIAVAAINLISALLIVIIENMSTIGLLKSFGYDNKSIRKIFLYFSAYLTLKGIFWGNIIALIVAYIQSIFHILPLDAKYYYISYVPIGFDWTGLLILNTTSIILIISILLIPTYYISNISPIKVIRFN